MASNQEQIDYWNGEAGATWVTAQERLDAMLAPISDALIDRAAVRAGERAIDVGCGCGATSIELARRGAAVWGIDISGPMLDRARSRSAGVKNVAFSRKDAAEADFTPDHDLLFSRFGVMFFADPPGAFRNLHGALRAKGRLAFVCWQAPRDNPWVAIAGRAIQPFLPEPEVEPDPKAPGPFAFADPDYVRGILDAAGFAAIELEDFRTTLHLADDLEKAIEFQGQVGPVARALAELEGEKREAALAATRDALAPHVTDAGLDLGAACWIVTARRG